MTNIGPPLVALSPLGGAIRLQAANAAPAERMALRYPNGTMFLDKSKEPRTVHPHAVAGTAAVACKAHDVPQTPDFNRNFFRRHFAASQVRGRRIG